MIVILPAAWMIQACSRFEPGAPADDEILDGTVEGLSFQQQAEFLAGDVAFNGEVFSTNTGLGPVFVATSCASCHAGDGKGHPFTTLIRFGQTDSTGNHFLHLGGPQLQNRAIPGYLPEQIPTGATFSKFTPPINTGMGFLELVSDSDILAMAAANAGNPNGVRGHPNWNTIPDYITPTPENATQNGKYICRFGKKGAVFNLLQQTVSAYSEDIGIASSFIPHDVYSMNEIDPEVSDKTIRDVVFYLQTLKAPIQRNQNDPLVVEGKDIFARISCTDCHKPTLKTGYSPVKALSFKEFHPYTDLLVHDMGPDLDDGYTEGNAKTSEWRTPPLWGLGLAPNSQGGQYFLLHDGRARSIEEAIQFHGGEATASRNSFNQLSQPEKDALIKFLESL